MVTWAYRVVLRDDEYAIYEVYYDADGDIEAFTEAPVYPRGSTVEELRQDLQRYQEALDQPAFDFDVLSAMADEAEPSDAPWPPDTEDTAP